MQSRQEVNSSPDLSSCEQRACVQASPFASPFAKPTAASPFSQQPAEQSPCVASAGTAEGRQKQKEAPKNAGMCNPFAAAQQGLAGRIG